MLYCTEFFNITRVRKHRCTPQTALLKKAVIICIRNRTDRLINEFSLIMLQSNYITVHGAHTSLRPVARNIHLKLFLRMTPVSRYPFTQRSAKYLGVPIICVLQWMKRRSGKKKSNKKRSGIARKFYCNVQSACPESSVILRIRYNVPSNNVSGYYS